MSNVVSLGGVRGYVAPARGGPAVERGADEALRPQDIADLVWIWQGAEAEMGIRSTFGAQCERAAQAQPTEDAVLDARRYQRERVRDWVALGHDAADPGSPRWDVETMPVHETPPYATQDPYADDRILQTIARERRINAVLRRCSRDSIAVLFAVYGPPRGDEEQRRDARKKFGDLVEVVTAIVAFQRTDADPPARAIVSAKLTDDSFVRILKVRAAGMLRAAARDYAGAR